MAGSNGSRRKTSSPQKRNEAASSTINHGLNGMGEAKVSEMGMREFGSLMSNMMSRIDLIRDMNLDSRKDVYEACNVPKVVTPEMYWNLYDKEPIPARIVECLPKEAWQVQPMVYESEDSEEATEFEKEWDGLGKQIMGEESWYQDEEGNPIYQKLMQADIDSRIGQYGIIVIGIDDGKQLDEEATMGGGEERRKLLYLQSYPQKFAKIIEWETDENSPRFCKPLLYEITYNDPKNLGSSGGLGSLPAGSTKKVHWTRVVHLCDGGDIAAPEAMRQVFPQICGLQKLYFGSPEMYWRGAFPGIGFTTHPNLGTRVNIKKAELQRMMESYFQDFQRSFAVSGLNAQQFSTQVVDPTPQIAVLIEAICIKLGIPVRVFKGSERGELASSQDDASWNDRLKFRQKFYMTPKIIVPFVNRLISLGVLPVPEGFSVYWPDLTSQTEQEKADVMAKRIDVMVKFISGNVETLMTPLDFLVREMKYNEKEAMEILEAAAEAVMEKEEEAARMQAEAMAQMADQANAPALVDGKGNPVAAPGKALPGKGQALALPAAKAGKGAVVIANEDWEDDEDEIQIRITDYLEYNYDPLTGNVFCSTGKGGGIDPTCKEGEGSSKEGGEKGADEKGGLHSKPKALPSLKNVDYEAGGEDALKSVFGDVDIKRVAAASNAKEGAEISVKPMKGSTAVEVTVFNPDGGVAQRIFYKDATGKTYVSNRLFKNPPEAKERGADVLAEQVKSLRELGVSYIKTDATRDDTPPPMVGHIVWPKLGYEGKLSDEQFKKLPAPIRTAMGEKKGTLGVFGRVPGSRSVQQLHEIPGGPEAWAKTGSTIYNMTFDLSDDSPNMKKLDSYLKGRKAKG